MYMMKVAFIILGIIGVIVISALGFIIPEKPFEIIPAITPMSFDKPIWACYMFGGGFIYIILLIACYDTICAKNKEV